MRWELWRLWILGGGSGYLVDDNLRLSVVIKEDCCGEMAL
jgi:hypothetical protein